MNNSGHNCIASQILVLPREWDGTERLLDEIRRVLRALPPRTDYYPGAAQRLDAVRRAHPEAESHGRPRLPPPGPRHHRPRRHADHRRGLRQRPRRRTAPGRHPGRIPAPRRRLRQRRLPGTLGATLIVHPGTEKAHRPPSETAVADLRYGTLGVNCWSGVGFLLGYTPWGAYPGHTRQDIGSGIGFVHNAFMLEDIEKTVLRAPFAPHPARSVHRLPVALPAPAVLRHQPHRTRTLERVTRFTAAPSPLQLPAIFASAFRG